MTFLTYLIDLLFFYIILNDILLFCKNILFLNQLILFLSSIFVINIGSIQTPLFTKVE